jgi:hypothetical protein
MTTFTRYDCRMSNICPYSGCVNDSVLALDMAADVGRVEHDASALHAPVTIAAGKGNPADVEYSMRCFNNSTGGGSSTLFIYELYCLQIVMQIGEAMQ